MSFETNHKIIFMINMQIFLLYAILTMAFALDEGCYRNCKTCASFYDCTSCYDGFYWDSIFLSCWKCGIDCTTCSSETTCTSCFNQSLSTVCYDCPIGCNSCSAQGTCNNCSYKYYITNNSTCQPCPSNCKICTNGSNCIACLYNFYLLNEECKQCVYGCTSCLDNIGCTSCENSINYFLTNGTCKDCGYLCANCVDNIGCTTCTYNYTFIQNQVCYSCSYACASCNNHTICLTCDPDYYLSNGACSYCGNGCGSCIDNIGCTSCNNNLNYYSQSDVCRFCGSGCTNCVDGVGCASCPNNYYVIDKVCQSCSDGCFQNKIQVFCRKCKGFQCTYCIQQSPSSQKPILIIALAISGLFLALLITFILFRVYKKAKVQDSQSQKNYPKDSLEKIVIKGQQITQISLQLQWKKIPKIKNSLNCMICLSHGNSFLQCNHSFHPICLNQWLKRKDECPTCQSQISQNSNLIIVCEMCNQAGLLKPLKLILKLDLNETKLCQNCKIVFC